MVRSKAEKFIIGHMKEISNQKGVCAMFTQKVLEPYKHNDKF